MGVIKFGQGSSFKQDLHSAQMWYFHLQVDFLIGFKNFKSASIKKYLYP